MDVDVNTKDFIAGLKTIIRTSWPTQEEFAKGVTSKVNLSNVLRGTGGTSYAMRKALAEKAGMSIDAVTKIGQQAAGKTPHTTLADILPRICADRGETEQIPFGGSITEVMNTASEFTLGLHSNVTHYAQSMMAMIKDITVERDKLVNLLAQEQLICNTMDEALKVVTREKRAIYVNRSMMEKFQVTPGDIPASDSCGLCGRDVCLLIDEVFTKGRIVRRLVTHELGTLFLTGYPIMDKEWKVERVLVVIQLGSVWLDLLREQGWAPPSGS